jgi:hypothetical protein
MPRKGCYWHEWRHGEWECFRSPLIWVQVVKEALRGGTAAMGTSETIRRDDEKQSKTMGVSPSWSRVGGSRGQLAPPLPLLSDWPIPSTGEKRKQMKCPPAHHPHPPISSGSALSARPPLIDRSGQHVGIYYARQVFSVFHYSSLLCLSPSPSRNPTTDASRSSFLPSLPHAGG